MRYRVVALNPDTREEHPIAETQFIANALIKASSMSWVYEVYPKGFYPAVVDDVTGAGWYWPTNGNRENL